MDRFICRREGHIPAVTVKKASGVTIKSWITSCRRCGKVYEVQNTGKSRDQD